MPYGSRGPRDQPASANESLGRPSLGRERDTGSGLEDLTATTRMDRQRDGIGLIAWLTARSLLVGLVVAQPEAGQGSISVDSGAGFRDLAWKRDT